MPPECRTCGTNWVNGAPACDCDRRDPKDIIRDLRARLALLEKVAELSAGLISWAELMAEKLEWNEDNAASAIMFIENAKAALRELTAARGGK